MNDFERLNETFREREEYQQQQEDRQREIQQQEEARQREAEIDAHNAQIAMIANIALAVVAAYCVGSLITSSILALKNIGKKDAPKWPPIMIATSVLLLIGCVIVFFVVNKK